MKLSLQAKMALSFSMGLAILLIVGTIAWQANSRQLANSALVAHTHQVLSHTEALLSALTEAESAARGYTISGDAAFIEPFEEILQDVESQYRHLLGLTVDNPAQEQRLFALKPLIDRRVAALTALIQMRRQMGFDYVQERFGKGKGKQWQEEIRTRIEEMERTEQALLRARAGDTAFASQASRLAITLGTLFAVLITVVSYLVMRYDIERRAAAEQALRIANGKLAAATERAQNADNIKSAFLATMSHELRTPLNSIIGFSGVMLQELPGPLNAEQKKQLGMVRDSSRHLLALVNDVLDISKVEAGQLRIQPQLFDMRVAIERAIGLVTPLALKKGLAIGTDIKGDLGQAFTDRRRFEQVLINLLNNAVKFTDHGSVVLRAELIGPQSDDAGAASIGFTPITADADTAAGTTAASGTASVALSDPASGTPPGEIADTYAEFDPARYADVELFRIEVADTGIGIDAQHLPDLFQPFRQLEDGLSRQHEGTGLGLAICQRLLLLMGGNIAVASVPGQGSTFTVTLPRHGNTL